MESAAPVSRVFVTGDRDLIYAHVNIHIGLEFILFAHSTFGQTDSYTCKIEKYITII